MHDEDVVLYIGPPSGYLAFFVQYFTGVLPILLLLLYSSKLIGWYLNTLLTYIRSPPRSEHSA